LTNAYRALANGGLFSAPVFAPRVDAKTRATVRVADAAAVFLTTDILADNNARARTFGLDSALGTRGFAAVKTGTSKDMRDNWCIGYTDRYTVGVWVGNASGEAMHSVSGVSGAAPVWQAVMRHLHSGKPSLKPTAPGGVVSARVAFDAQREPPRDEVFIAGTEQPVQRASAAVMAGGNAPGAGITSPRDGSVFALDPDIPPAAQRISFEGERGVWVLDGKRLGAATRWPWVPWPGPHRLVLLGRDGQPIQSVRFEVRGAGVKTARR
jgi:penicillin-binding protein 1C